MNMRVFVDSDVVISALISSRGAAHFLLTQSSIKPVISSISYEEIHKVAVRMELDLDKLESLIQNNIEVGSISLLDQQSQEYGQFVTDPHDAHIIAGAHMLNMNYLISYNLRHFKADMIKDKLNIVLLTPALFLQYLRSQS